MDSAPVKNLLQSLNAYTGWADQKILAAAGRVADADLRAPRPPDERGLLDALFHVLYFQALWRSVAEMLRPPANLLVKEALPDLPALAAAFAAEAQAMHASLAGLSEDFLSQPVSLRRPSGGEQSLTPAQMLIHRALHSMQHRSEIALQLTLLGHSPGGVDYVHFLQEAAGSAG